MLALTSLTLPHSRESKDNNVTNVAEMITSHIINVTGIQNALSLWDLS